MNNDTIKSFVGLLLLLFLIEFSGAQPPSSQWKHTLAFPYEEGKDSVMVQTGYVKDGSIQLIYELPVAKTKKLDKKLGNTNMSQVILGSAPATANEGEPVLPVIPVKVIIPKGYSIEKNKIKVSRGGKTQVPGIHYVTYGEAAFPLIPGAKPRKAEPKQHIYNSDNAFPGKSFNLVTVQRKHGVTVAYINLHPITYHPKSGKLFCYRNISLKIPIKRVNTGIDPKVQGHAERFNFKQIGVDNPEDLKSYQTRSLASLAPIGICNPLENYQYVIVTNQAVRDATTDVTVMDLIAHKQARGLTATIVTIEDIYANYSGVDNAEKLRNFIIDAYNTWGTEYVLLGGDTNILPFRYLNANGTSIPSDLYFQCLDGTFDFDGDGIWGEPTDGPEGGEVDLTAEVYIGRASAENADEMSNFVYKTLAYENEVEGAPYLRNALIAGEYLGSQFGPGEFAYAMPYMDEIHFGSSASGYTTVGFSSCASFTVNTLYDYDGTWPSSEIIDRINSGTYSIINHLGHANTNYVFKLYNSSADGLTNNNYIFAYSQGCIPGDYTADCIGEHLTTSHRYGMYAVVLNSRYGWGAYNDSRETMDGPSQRFNRQFWDAYFGEYIYNLGTLNADSHEDNIWDINGNYIRWCFYESNLLGDPHTPLRGQIIGPSVAYSSHVTSDATGGNGDGVVNPGEQIDITATLVNVGSGDATDVNAEISTSDSYISILDNTASFGDILCCGAAKQALDDFRISISSSCTTPYTATLDLTITDDQSNSWSSSFTITIYTSSQISGYVTTFTGGNPVEGATVEFTGPMSGSVQTNASGYYMFGGIDGTYNIIARSDDYLPSAPMEVTVPPDIENINFTLSRPEFSYNPEWIKETVEVGDSTIVNATITNNGDASLEFYFSINSTTASLESIDILGDPVAHWNFNEGEGNTLSDISGNEHHGAIHGAAWTEGVEGNALNFDGNDYVEVPYNEQLDNPEAFTIAVWAKSNIIGEDYFEPAFIIDMGFVADSGYGFFHQYTPEAKTIVGYYNNSDVKDLTISLDTEWHFYVMTYGDGTLTYYLDGEKINTNTVGTGVIDNKPLRIGAQSKSLRRYWNGIIDEINLFDHSLSDAEVQALYHDIYFYWLSVSPSEGVVPIGETFDFDVKLNSREILGGTYTSFLAINHNSPVNPNPEFIPCTLYVKGPRRLSVSPESYDFNPVWVGLYDSTIITLINDGDEATLVNSITSDNPEFTPDVVLPITVPPFGSETFKAKFTPTELGVRSGILTINSNAEDNPVLTVSLTGTGIQPPGISVVPDNFHEQLDCGGTVTRILTIENPGGDILDFDISIEQSSLQDNFMHRVQKPYHFNGNNFHTISSVDDTLNGLEIDEITIKPLSMLALDLTGIRIVYDRAHGERSSSILTTILNDLIARGAVIYENFDSLSIQLLDTIDILWIDDNASIPFSASEVSELDEWLHSGGAILMHSDQPGPLSTIFEPHGITFKQKETSEITTNIISHTVTQKVKSVYIPNAVSALGVENNAVPIILDKGGVSYVCISEVGKGKIVAICDELLADYYIGKCDNRILGNRAVDWLASGEYADYWLSVNPISGSVNPDGSMDLNVEFNSEDLIAGDYACNILVVHNAPAEPSPVSIPATLTVNSLRDLSVDPQQFTFSDIWIGNREATIFTLSNPGNAATTVNSIISNNPVFTHNAVLPFSVPPFESVAFEVEFAPVELGMESGVLTINSDAENNPITVSLSGAGVAPPEITVSPSSFNEVLYMGHSLTRTLTINNNGGDDLSYSIIKAGSNMPTDLLVSYWPFNEGTGDVLIDEIGNNNGVVNGAMWIYDNGRSALSFDGTDDVVIIPNPLNGSMDFGTGDFSVAVWINTTANTGSIESRDEIISKGDASMNGFALSARNNKACFWVGSSVGYLGSTDINDGEWHLVVGVREAGTVRLYVDANLETSGSNSNNVNTSTDFFIGMHGTKALCYFDGLISSTYLYARALTVDEIEDIYGVPSWLTITDPSGAVQSGSFADINIVFESAGLAEGIYSGRLDILHNAPGTPVPLVVPCALTVIDQIPSTSRILFIGQSASTAAYGNNYIMEEIIIGSPTSGTAKGSKYQIELK